MDAIFEATIQVLLLDGPYRLTTTRVAERAGVSVGTLYQYYPNKQALFYAINGRYLDDIAEKVERACKAHHGASIDTMIKALVTTYWDAKMARPEETRALYRSIAELDNEALIASFMRRTDAASTAMLATTPCSTFPDLPTVTLTLLATIFGTVRYVFERNLTEAETEAIRSQLLVMCNAYIAAIGASAITRSSI
ncbi:TetR/AcrR family transcriptional regulator [Falsirhodobacter halotolerans]|uniref:TetR/AcrR family transcriptional regulator n=1 Tax=Falsirhodobacter halotolerans TaxID=1146892 RepID=UPI001FD39B87|nr:TetR/AcrR family transcriptional regulator [Falsirhodobacter halotolerans]MCJ8138282.1 TetR/AcrR family transcriptional regulator [Falsirhodobacter halotolerans]